MKKNASDDEYKSPYNIDVWEGGYWDSLEVHQDFYTCLKRASQLSGEYGEKNFRIYDANNKII
jgi:hypothetical protein